MIKLQNQEVINTKIITSTILKNLQTIKEQTQEQKE
jgi:hypothetical protein